MRISDWSSDVCSSDLSIECFKPAGLRSKDSALVKLSNSRPPFSFRDNLILLPRTCASFRLLPVAIKHLSQRYLHIFSRSTALGKKSQPHRSEEHTSELQSLMRISYAVFCLKKKKISAP